MKLEIENLGAGKFLIPGLIDAHVHFRDPGFPEKETWETGAVAALAGGVTSVMDMPNTNPPTITVKALEAKRAMAVSKLRAAQSKLQFGLFFGATKDNLDEIRRAENICGIKIYMGSSTGDLLLDDLSLLEQVFQIAKEKDVPVVVHAETQSMIQKGKRDCECAELATKQALQLREKVGNRLHIAHLSCKSELELLRAYKCPQLSCEVTPHHLFFTELDVKDGFLKVNPPLRSEEDRDALWEGLRDGTIDILASDHAPHTIQEKQSVNPPAGVPGIEFMLPLMLNAVHKGQISLERLAQLSSLGPSRIFRVPVQGKVLIDMNLEKTIQEGDIKSKCAWSPYKGRTLKGWPIQVFI